MKPPEGSLSGSLRLFIKEASDDSNSGINVLKVNATSPDLRFPAAPQSLEKRQQERNMVRTCRPRVLGQHDERFKAGFVFTTVGTPGPAKPSEGMPAELDPGLGGVCHGGVKMCQGQKPNKASDVGGGSLRRGI